MRRIGGPGAVEGVMRKGTTRAERGTTMTVDTTVDTRGNITMMNMTRSESEDVDTGRPSQRDMDLVAIEMTATVQGRMHLLQDPGTQAHGQFGSLARHHTNRMLPGE
mmetsp:Transcript_10390/g.12168  ORF Transcript_10390/g.12168 Transcript_10390/m.12168 type:complete len:107 (+) Transcript_10390:782-1102(+)